MTGQSVSGAILTLNSSTNSASFYGKNTQIVTSREFAAAILLSAVIKFINNSNLSANAKWWDVAPPLRSRKRQNMLVSVG